MNDVIAIINSKNKQIDELQDKLIKHLKDYVELKQEFEQWKKESIKWSKYDFIDLEDDYEITDEQAQDALEEMIRKTDCNYGVTWETVKYYKSIYGTKKETNEQ